MKTLMRAPFGSHLYGTATADSDRDEKGVYLPDINDLLLNRVRKSIATTTKLDHHSKNTATDIDTEHYSLHYFLELARQGETVAIDLLHVPLSSCIEVTDTWAKIHAARSNFYTKNMKSFVGYARRQAAKYGVKGSRLAAAKYALWWLEANAYESQRLAEVWDRGLPVQEHITKDTAQTPRVWSVCGRSFQATASVKYVKGILQRFIKEYGARAMAAEQNNGVDWKAVSHAFRAAYQMLEILQTGDLKFPLASAPKLLAIKSGSLKYTQVAPELDDLITQVEELAAQSSFPDMIPQDLVDKLLLTLLKDEYRKCGITI